MEEVYATVEQLSEELARAKEDMKKAEKAFSDDLCGATRVPKYDVYLRLFRQVRALTITIETMATKYNVPEPTATETTATESTAYRLIFSRSTALAQEGVVKEDLDDGVVEEAVDEGVVDEGVVEEEVVEEGAVEEGTVEYGAVENDLETATPPPTKEMEPLSTMKVLCSAGARWAGTAARWGGAARARAAAWRRGQGQRSKDMEHKSTTKVEPLRTLDEKPLVTLPMATLSLATLKLEPLVTLEEETLATLEME